MTIIDPLTNQPAKDLVTIRKETATHLSLLLIELGEWVAKDAKFSRPNSLIKEMRIKISQLRSDLYNDLRQSSETKISID